MARRPKRKTEPAPTSPKPAALRTAAEGRLALYLDPSTHYGLRMAAAHRGISKSAAAALAIQEWLRLDPPPGYEPMAGGAVPRTDRTPAQAERRARELQRGRATQKAIAAELNREGYRTARGRRWNVVSVGRMLRAR